MTVIELAKRRELTALIGAAKSTIEAKKTALEEHSRQPIGTWNHAGVNGVERGVKAENWNGVSGTRTNQLPGRAPEVTGRDKIIQLDRGLLVRVVKSPRHDELRAARLRDEQVARQAGIKTAISDIGSVGESIMARLRAMTGQAASE